jgi:hypothetical protein
MRECKVRLSHRLVTGFVYVIMLAVAAMFSQIAFAENRAEFPENFDQYVRYAIYDRGSSKEEAFALPETIELSKSGKPLPPGTQLVLGIWTDYKLTGYFVMHKGIDWGLEVEEARRTGDWHFQQFGLDKQVKRTAFAERCESCHQSAASDDFMYTIDRMRDYLP